VVCDNVEFRIHNEHRVSRSSTTGSDSRMAIVLISKLTNGELKDCILIYWRISTSAIKFAAIFDAF